MKKSGVITSSTLNIIAQNYYSTSCTFSSSESADFILTQTSLLFTLGSVPGTSQSVVIDILDDNILENTESFSVAISFSTMSTLTTVLCPDSATVTVMDNDGSI